MKKIILVLLVLTQCLCAYAGMDFTNPSDRIDADSSEDWNFGTCGFVLSVWFNMDTYAGDRAVFGGQWGADNRMIFTHIDQSTNKVIVDWDGSAGTGSLEFVEVLSTGTDYHFVVLRVGGSILMYLNGVSKSLTGSQIGSFTLLDDSTRKWEMGGQSSSSALTFDGKLWDARIYCPPVTAFSEAEILSIYNSRGNDNITRDMVARWLYNEETDGTTASGADKNTDVSGSGNQGTPIDSPTYVATPLRTRNRSRSH